MASNSDVNSEKLRKDISALLKGADLSQLSAKKIRKQLEDDYGRDLTYMKKEIDAILMELIEEDVSHAESTTQSKSSQNGEEAGGGSGQDEADSDSEFEEPEDTGPPKKKMKNVKGASGSKSKVKGKSKAESTPGSTKKKNSYSRELVLSPSLAELMGQEQMARSEVVKKMWAIIKERNLADPKNRQFTICDAELQAVFGRKRFRTFGMMKYLKDHMFTPEEYERMVVQK